MCPACLPGGVADAATCCTSNRPKGRFEVGRAARKLPGRRCVGDVDPLGRSPRRVAPLPRGPAQATGRSPLCGVSVRTCTAYPRFYPRARGRFVAAGWEMTGRSPQCAGWSYLTAFSAGLKSVDPRVFGVAGPTPHHGRSIPAGAGYKVESVQHTGQVDPQEGDPRKREVAERENLSIPATAGNAPSWPRAPTAADLQPHNAQAQAAELDPQRSIPARAGCWSVVIRVSARCLCSVCSVGFSYVDPGAGAQFRGGVNSHPKIGRIVLVKRTWGPETGREAALGSPDSL